MENRLQNRSASQNLSKTGMEVIRFETKAGATVQKPNRLHFPTSIDTLSPNNRFVRALNTLPIADHIPYHSIIGDRGRGDTPKVATGLWLIGVLIWRERDRNKSYRQTTALTKTRRGVEEVHRILLLNLTQQKKGP
jgi:hypothetical protein